MLRTLISSLIACLLGATKGTPMDTEKPWIIAHRGASGYTIEHTVEAYTLAHQQGADFIEQDVVLTRDGVPVVLHDIYLEVTTDVANRFPGRAREDGHFYAIDFDWDEIRQLEKQPPRDLVSGTIRYPKRYPDHSVRGRVMSLAQSLELIEQLNRETGRQAGIFPELKMPRFHASEGQDIAAVTMEVLEQFAYLDGARHWYLQSFDPQVLKLLREQYGESVRLVQLIGENHWLEAEGVDHEAMRTHEGLDRIADYANAIGPHWPQVLRNVEWIPLEPENEQIDPEWEWDRKVMDSETLVEAAHRRGLKVFTFTLRREGLPRWVGFEALHLKLFEESRVDGVFSDFPDQSKKIRDGWLRRVMKEK